MTGDQWFSAKIRLACLVDPTGLVGYRDAIYIFQSYDFDDAFKRALGIGKSQETSYLNANQQPVKWKLKEIISLDVVGSAPLESGTEVHSEPVEPLPSEQFSFEHEFDPATSKPTQTI